MSDNWHHYFNVGLLCIAACTCMVYCTTCFVQWVEGYLVACMSHYIVDPTRLCDPCTCICTLSGMCDQRHYNQVLYVLYVRQSK